MFRFNPFAPNSTAFSQARALTLTSMRPSRIFPRSFGAGNRKALHTAPGNDLPVRVLEFGDGIRELAMGRRRFTVEKFLQAEFRAPVHASHRGIRHDWLDAARAQRLRYFLHLPGAAFAVDHDAANHISG